MDKKHIIIFYTSESEKEDILALRNLEEEQHLEIILDGKIKITTKNNNKLTKSSNRNSIIIFHEKCGFSHQDYIKMIGGEDAFLFLFHHRGDSELEAKKKLEAIKKEFSKQVIRYRIISRSDIIQEKLEAIIKAYEGQLDGHNQKFETLFKLIKEDFQINIELKTLHQFFKLQNKSIDKKYIIRITKELLSYYKMSGNDTKKAIIDEYIHDKLVHNILNDCPFDYFEWLKDFRDAILSNYSTNK